MNQATAHSTNFFLDGNFSPVTDERDAQDMMVKGSIPKDLAGHFLRVGPNPVHLFSEDAYHTFDGDGMIHAIEFSNGNAHYRNRFVQTEGFKLEQERGDWIYKGMNSMLDPTPSREPGEHGVCLPQQHLVRIARAITAHCDRVTEP